MTKVLVVDDFQEHIDTLVNTFNLYGCEARGTSRAAEGLVMVDDWQPHLVVCDDLMEDMRAWKFGYRLLNQNLSYRPYLVALTGFGSTLHRRLCEECGYDEYVTKPIELSTLLNWIQRARDRAVQSTESRPR